MKFYFGSVWGNTVLCNSDGSVVDITDTYTFENFVIPIINFLSEQCLHGFFGSGMCIIDNADETPFNVRECTFTVDNKNVTITD